MNSEWEEQDDRAGDALMDRIGNCAWAEAPGQIKDVENDSFFNVIDNDNNNNQSILTRTSPRPDRRQSNLPHDHAAAANDPADSTVVSDVSEDLDSDADETTTTMTSSMFENEAESASREPPLRRDAIEDNDAMMASGDPSANVFSTPASRSNAKKDPKIQMLGTPPSWQPEPVDLSKKKKSLDGRATEERRLSNVKTDSADGISTSANVKESNEPDETSSGSVTSDREIASRDVGKEVEGVSKKGSLTKKAADPRSGRQTPDLEESSATLSATSRATSSATSSATSTAISTANAPILPSPDLIDDLPGLICFSPFQMNFILSRGTKCVAFHDLMQKSPDDKNEFVFQSIDPFTSKGQEKVSKGKFGSLIS